MDLTDNFQMLVRLGDIYYQNHDYERAMDFFQKAVDLSIEDVLKKT